MSINKIDEIGNYLCDDGECTCRKEHVLYDMAHCAGCGQLFLWNRIDHKKCLDCQGG